MFDKNNRLIKLLEIDNASQMTKKEYDEMILLLDETRERIIQLSEAVEYEKVASQKD